MKPFKGALTVFVLLISMAVPLSASASTTVVSNFSELQAALSNAIDGDTIEFSDDIIATTRLSTNKDLTIDGKGFLWSVTTPGLNDAGLPNPSPSNHGLITFQNGSVSTLKNVNMWGGSNTSTGLGTVRIDSGASLRILDSSVERSYTDTSTRRGGGGIINYGTTVLDRVKVRRNGAGYGGGFLNYSNLIIMNSTFSDNRSTSTSGGGGAGENGSGGKLWIVNSTFANNLSTEIGSAINNYTGQFFIAHSTFVGNLGTSSSYKCGAIGVNNGSGKIVSSLFAYNYEVVSGAFALMDLGNTTNGWSGCRNASVEVDHSLIHSSSAADATAGWLSSKGTGNISYSATVDGQTAETLFSGGALMRPSGGNGSQISAPSSSIFRPNLIFEGQMPIAKLKESNTTPGISSAAPIYFSEDGASTTLAFWDASLNSWSVMSGTLPAGITSSTDANLMTDQVGTPHLSPSALGATELTSAQTFSVVAVKASGGDVTGASVYGDAFAANSRVEISAIPDTGYSFSKWEIELESGSSLATLMSQPWNQGIALMSSSVESTSNPITFAVTTNTTIRPVFISATAGTNSVVYAANGATGGSAPLASTETNGQSYTVLANTGTLLRTGFAFAGWNTASNGSGTSYDPGDTLTISTNLTFFAQWTPVTSVTISFSGNGSESGSAPANSSVAVGASFTIPGNSGNLARQGFSFGGWNTQANGLGTPLAAGATITGSTDLTLHAVWSAVIAPPAASNVETAPAAYSGPIIEGVEPRKIYVEKRQKLSSKGRNLKQFAHCELVKLRQV